MVSAIQWGQGASRHPAEHLDNVALRLGDGMLVDVGTVEEVGKRLGDPDTSTFSHASKLRHGTAPSAFRRPR